MCLCVAADDEDENLAAAIAASLGGVGGGDEADSGGGAGGAGTSYGAEPPSQRSRGEWLQVRGGGLWLQVRGGGAGEGHRHDGCSTAAAASERGQVEGSAMAPA